MFFFSIDLDFVSYFPYNLGSQPKTIVSATLTSFKKVEWVTALVNIRPHLIRECPWTSLPPKKTAKFYNKMNYLHP